MLLFDFLYFVKNKFKYIFYIFINIVLMIKFENVLEMENVL